MSPKNAECTNCKKKFHLKPSAIKRYNRNMGIFCCQKCCTDYKINYYKGANNPNYRGRTYDNDGYRLFHYPKKGRLAIHRYNVFNHFGVEKLPKGYCIHHRDCDIYNNDLINLVVLSNSDHRWIHKNFGTAPLWGAMNGKIDIETLINLSTDKKRARDLLTLSVLDQKITDFI